MLRLALPNFELTFWDGCCIRVKLLLKTFLVLLLGYFNLRLLVKVLMNLNLPCEPTQIFKEVLILLLVASLFKGIHKDLALPLVSAHSKEDLVQSFLIDFGHQDLKIVLVIG